MGEFIILPLFKKAPPASKIVGGVCQYAPTIIFGELVTRIVAFKVGLLGLGTVGTGTS